MVTEANCEDLGNWRTAVFRGPTEDKVIKIDRSVAIIHTQKRGENNAEYRTRMRGLSLKFAMRERARAMNIKPFLPESVNVPEEHYFIGDTDGLPRAMREQDYVGGRALREIDLTSLNPDQNAVLGELAIAAIRGYEQTGEMLDLAGWQGGRNKSPITLIKLFINPFKYSSNIKIDVDGKVCLIDAKPVTAKNTLQNRFKRYVMYLRLVKMMTNMSY